MGFNSGFKGLKSTACCLSFPHVGITVFGHYEILRHSLI